MLHQGSAQSLPNTLSNESEASFMVHKVMNDSGLCSNMGGGSITTLHTTNYKTTQSVTGAIYERP